MHLGEYSCLLCVCGGSDNKPKQENMQLLLQAIPARRGPYFRSQLLITTFDNIDLHFTSVSRVKVKGPDSPGFICTTQNQAGDWRQQKQWVVDVVLYWCAPLLQLKGQFFFYTSELITGQTPEKAEERNEGMVQLFHSALSLTHQCNIKLLRQPC